MADLKHTWGQDLTLSATGGLASATGTTQGQEKVLRRLLTNPGDDIFNPEYGAGLPSFIGSPASGSRIQAVIRRQMRLEKYVDHTNSPNVEVETNPNGVTTASIQYVDATTGEVSLLTLPVRSQ